MKRFLLIIFLLWNGFNISAQSNTFSLDEAVQYAMQNNAISKNASNDLEIAQAKKWETIATGLPQISAFIDYANNIKQPISLVPAEFFGGNKGEFAEISFGTKQTFDGTATLNQLLFDGSYIVGLSSIKLYLEIADNAKKKTDLEVKRNVISAYGNVLVSHERVKFLKENLENVEGNLNEITKVYENGMTELENVEQLTITYSNLKNSLDYAVKLGNTSENILKMVIGLPLENEIILSDNLSGLTLKKIDMGLIDKPISINQNIDYIIANNEKKSQETLLRLEKSRALPTISAYVQGTYKGNSDSFDFLDYDQKWYGSSVAGVTMSIPVFSSLRRSAKTQQAKIEVAKASEELLQTEKRVLIELENAKTNYQFAINNFQNAQKNLSLAKKIEKKNGIKFIEGIASSFELRQAQMQLY